MILGMTLSGHLGAYTIVRELGSGGFGSVFLAAAETGVQVAVKVLNECKNADAKHRFRREMRILDGFKHRNVIEMIDHGAGPDDTVWYAMPVMNGGTLADVIARDRTWEEVVLILQQVAEGLDAYHNASGMHRDVKPENILLDETGVPKLADFGLARCPDITNSSMTHGANGTAPYMAPEVWKNQACPPSDVYALGIVFWELANGTRHKVPAKPPRLLNAGPGFELMDELYQSMTALDPGQRPSAAEVARTCALFIDHLRSMPAAAKEPETGKPVWPWIVGGLAVIGGIAAICYLADD